MKRPSELKLDAQIHTDRGVGISNADEFAVSESAVRSWSAETRMSAEELERFEAKISYEPMSGCWLWTASTSRGYGNLQMRGRSRRAHQVSYEHHVGPIPNGLVLDHLCRQRCCVNPEHLEPVTSRENVLRGDTLPARNIAAEICVNGHPFDAKNTYRNPRGKRECRQCRRVSQQRLYYERGRYTPLRPDRHRKRATP